ncbi:MAG: elongation factor G [Candidatus Aminicenantes bacterium]|nr:elongation factor G [Candidatus Aminicenantes bacterium]
MRTVAVDRIRNIGLMAHIDAGKTTTTERILYYSGVTYKMGEVDAGTAVMDWMDQEQERGITITAAATTCFWNDCRINIIDTPGHVDFTAEVERSLRVLDGAIIVLCGVGGVEPQTEKVWFQSVKYRIPKIAYVNKMDRVGSDFFDVVAQIENKFKIVTLPLQLPLGTEDSFSGVIDLITMKAYNYNGELLGTRVDNVEIPQPYVDDAHLHREHLIERLAEFDNDIMELFLDKKDIPEECLKKAVRTATLGLKAVPVLLGSSFKNKGIQNLLDAVIDYLPSPADKADVLGSDPKTGKALTRKLSDQEPMSALVFKIMSDPYVGQLIYFRVYSGLIKVGSTVFNSRKNQRLRVAKLLKMHSNKREEVTVVHSGDIAATVGLKEISTGDTLCDERHPIQLDTIRFPEPVVTATIEPRLTSEHQKLDEVLRKLTIEDPTLKSYVDSHTGQSIISGMGELHLEIIQERIKREYKIQTKLGKPRVAYYETIRKPARGEEKYVKQSGGKGQYGHVILELKPYSRDGKFKFTSKLKANVIPKEFHQAIEQGVLEAMDIGIIAGFPITHVAVDLLDGSYHEEDSTELAYKIAASMAFKNAFRKGSPIMLEPVMKIEIVVQDDYLGEVMADFNSRQGKVTNMDLKNGLHVIDGQVPLSLMFGYATALRTLTQGRANYSLEFFKYSEMSEDKMNEVLKTQLGIYTCN